MAASATYWSAVESKWKILVMGRHLFRCYLFRRVLILAGLRPAGRTNASAPTRGLAKRHALSLVRLVTARCGLLFPGRPGGLLRSRPGVGLWLRRWLLRGLLFSSCGRRWRTWY